MGKEDRELARRAQQGDVAAYAELVRRHRRMVYGIALAILGCADEAEDVTQEAFVRAHRAIRQYSRRYAFATWMRRIAVNCSVNRIRERDRRRRLGEGVAANHATEAAADPHDLAAARELDGRVRAEIERLPLNQRLAISLFALDGMTLSETAEAMGCSVGAVKSHVHRARGKLARKLSDDLQEDVPWIADKPAD